MKGNIGSKEWRGIRSCLAQGRPVPSPTPHTIKGKNKREKKKLPTTNNKRRDETVSGDSGNYVMTSEDAGPHLTVKGISAHISSSFTAPDEVREGHARSTRAPSRKAPGGGGLFRPGSEARPSAGPYYSPPPLGFEVLDGI